MSMHLRVKWLKPFRLQEREGTNLTYCCDELEDIPEESGVYVFARTWGDMVPIYVGQASVLRQRIAQQLTGNVKLMNGIHNAPAGHRRVLVGVLDPRRGQQVDRALKVVEDTLIARFLEEGYELLNNRGTKTKHHELQFRGNRTCKKLTGPTIGVPER